MSRNTVKNILKANGLDPGPKRGAGTWDEFQKIHAASLCLDYFVVFGEKHMDYLVSEMVAHYHEERPHQGKENKLLTWGSTKPTKRRKRPGSPPDVMPLGDIQCRQRLDGLLKHYCWKAA